MLPINKPNYQISRLIFSFCRNLQQHQVVPKKLSLNKVNGVLNEAGFTFYWVKLKACMVYKPIP